MPDTIFISGPFTGTSPLIRSIVTSTFGAAGHTVLEKNGSVPDTVASLIDRSDGMVFVLGATLPAIEDVWGRSLVELELAYARYRLKPVVPILLSVEDEDDLHPALRYLRASVRRQFGDRVIIFDEYHDFDPSDDEAQRPGREQILSVAEKLAGVVALGWRRFSGLMVSNKVFISHSHHDKPQAERIMDELMRYEFEPWVDKYRLDVGMDIAREIRRAVEMAGAVVVLLSERSVDSEWVREEVRLALEQEAKRADETGALILPVRLEPVVLPEELSFLEQRLWVDFYGGATVEKAALAKLVNGLRSRYASLTVDE